MTAGYEEETYALRKNKQIYFFRSLSKKTWVYSLMQMRPSTQLLRLSVNDTLDWNAGDPIRLILLSTLHDFLNKNSFWDDFVRNVTFRYFVLFKQMDVTVIFRELSFHRDLKTDQLLMFLYCYILRVVMEEHMRPGHRGKVFILCGFDVLCVISV